MGPNVIVTLLAGSFGTLVALVVILLAFKRQFGDLMARASKVSIHLGRSVSFEVDGATVQDAFRDLFTEMDTVVRTLLTVDERSLFLKIVDGNKDVSVQEVMGGFNREPDKLKRLRALRGVSFIRPKEGGNWQADKTIQVTTLGRLVGTHMREALMAGQ